MALFKILKGHSSRIDMGIPPFHDGYAYFTANDGDFYIDSEDNGKQKRIHITPPEQRRQYSDHINAAGIRLVWRTADTDH